MTEHLAMVICLQLVEDYAELMTKLGLDLRYSQLNIHTFNYLRANPDSKILRNKQAKQIWDTIFQNYEASINYLENYKYG